MQKSARRRDCADAAHCERSGSLSAPAIILLIFSERSVARGVRSTSAILFSDKTDPLSGPTCSSRLGRAAAADRRRRFFFAIAVRGERWSDRRGADGQNQLRWGGAGRAPRATGSSPTARPNSAAVTVFPRYAYSHRILVREGRAEPATSVSRATRDQTDPTRSSRLGGASPLSFSRYSALGRTLELGRWRGSDGGVSRMDHSAV